MLAEHNRGELAEPRQRGLRKIDEAKFWEHYQEPLDWAEDYAAKMKIEGTALSWQDIAKKALEDEAFGSWRSSARPFARQPGTSSPAWPKRLWKKRTTAPARMRS